MQQIKKIEKLLKDYEYNKIRIVFLQNQKKRFYYQEPGEYIITKMFNDGYTGSVPRFFLENNQEVAKLNNGDAVADNDKEKIREEYMKALVELDQELITLNYRIDIIDESIELLKRINEKYSEILQKNYIYKCTMGNIADSMHISRSRCYELRKAALEAIVKIVFGEQLFMKKQEIINA